MKRAWFTAVVGLTAAMLLVPVASLFAGGQAERSAPKSITVGGEAGGPYIEFFKKLAKERFTPKTGIQVNWIEVPHAEMHQKFLTEAASRDGAIDVFDADQPWVPQFAAAGYLLDLDKYLTTDDLSDFSKTALDTMSYEGKVFALPYFVHDCVLYYRKDLLKQAGITSLPTTWDQYVSDAKKLTANGVWGTIVEGKQDGAASAKFLDVVYQAGGSVFNSEGKVTIGKPWLQALEFYRDLVYKYKVAPPGAPTFDNADTETLFAQGKLAMAAGWPYMYSMFQDPKTSKVVGEVGIGEQPGLAKQTAAVFGWGFGINSSSKAPDTAVKFLKWATDTNSIYDLAKTFINPAVRESALAKLRADTTMTASDREAIAAMTKDVRDGRTIPMVPQWPQIDARIQWAISAVTSRQVTPEQAVSQLQTDITRIMKQ